MPCYPYRCLRCDHKFDIVKSVSHIDDIEHCPECSTDETQRYIAQVNFYGADGWDSEFNPGLGCVTKSRQHRAKLIKERGLIEVGNEHAEKTIEMNSKQRMAAEDKAFQKEFADVIERTKAS